MHVHYLDTITKFNPKHIHAHSKFLAIEYKVKANEQVIFGVHHFAGTVSMILRAIRKAANRMSTTKSVCSQRIILFTIDDPKTGKISKLNDRTWEHWLYATSL